MFLEQLISLSFSEAHADFIHRWPVISRDRMKYGSRGIFKTSSILFKVKASSEREKEGGFYFRQASFKGWVRVRNQPRLKYRVLQTQGIPVLQRNISFSTHTPS